MTEHQAKLLARKAQRQGRNLFWIQRGASWIAARKPPGISTSEFLKPQVELPVSTQA